VIGIWSTTARKDSSGHYRQVSRLGLPLITRWSSRSGGPDLARWLRVLPCCTRESPPWCGYWSPGALRAEPRYVSAG
jgi:hypothetical protein